MLQTILEITDRFDVKVRELGDALVLFLFSGSTSSNPYFMVRLYSDGKVRMVDMADVYMYGDPGNIKELDPCLKQPCNI